MPATVSLPLLAGVQIVSPCSARWEDMKVDAVARFCADCKLRVHNLSEMSGDQAESFLRERRGTGRVCTRFFRRADGTILTKDCPVGMALWRSRARHAVVRVAAALVLLGTGGFIATSRQREGLSLRLRAAQPFRAVCEWLNPSIAAPPAPIVGNWWIGDGYVSPQWFLTGAANTGQNGLQVATSDSGALAQSDSQSSVDEIPEYLAPIPSGALAIPECPR